MKWLLRTLRGPLWYAWNLLDACWNFDLRDMANRKNQRPVKYVAYKSLITLRILLTALYIFLLMVTVGFSAAVFFPTRWAYLEAYDLWSYR